MAQGPPAPSATRVNWAKYQETFSDSAQPGGAADFATDGIVDSLSTWRANSGPGGHWVGVILPAAREIGSVQLYLGNDETGAISNFTLNYDDGSGMKALPGGGFTDNTSTVLNVIFPMPVTMERFMLYTSDETSVVREISLLPPNGPGGWPIGTDVSLNLARQHLINASSTEGENFAKLAVNGFAGPDQAWRSANVNGPHSLTVELGAARRIGSAHVFSGSSGAPAVANFRLQYWDGGGWLDVPGGVVTGNTQKERVVNFASPVSTSRMLLLMQDNGQQTVRELALFQPATGIGSLPIGTSVTLTEPPTSRADDLGDGWWKLRNRHTGGTLASGGGSSMSEARPFTPEADGQFEVIYNIGSDTYRLRHRGTGQCLEAENAGSSPGTPVVLADYHGEPHQLWRIVPTSDGYGQYLHVWSGLALETDAGNPAAISLATPGTGWRQQWKLEFQKAYLKKGIADYGWDWEKANVSWNYNWAASPFGPLPEQVAFAPMQWGEGDIGALARRHGDWQSEGKPITLLGFNEPDFGNDAGGSDMPVATALDLWPQLEAADLPLVAPAPAVMFGSWINDFHSQAAARGYRIDYTGVHWYGPPDAAGLIGYLQGIYQNYGRPIWLTEFATTDFSGGFSWSEEDNYRFLAEFLWMAEDHPWLKRYSVFPGYSEVPANPWDLTEPHCHIFDPDRNLTAVGELYAGWDGDRAIRSATPYVLHNKGSSLRIGNNSGSLRIDTIRHHDAPMQWALVPATTAGRVHLASLADGSRLRWNGSLLEFASPASSGGGVEWTYTHESNGYHFIDHPQSGKRLALHRTNDANGAPNGIWHAMENSGTVNDSVRWRFVKPAEPAPVQQLPAGWEGADIGGSAIPGHAFFDESLGTWIVGGSGADIFGPSDQFHFAARDFTGDGSLVVRVAGFQNTDPHAKSGVMFRDGSAPDAAFAHVFLGPSGVGFEYRPTAGADAQSAGYDAGVEPRWLKLVRSGTSFSGYHSADGAAWTPLSGAQTVAIQATARAGLSVTAHTNAALNTSAFTHLSLLPPDWSSADIGEPGLPGGASYSSGNGNWSVSGSGADVWGTGDDFHFVSQSSAGDIVLTARVDALGNTDPWAKAGVMLRDSLDPGSSFAAVFATPSNGINFQYRSQNGAAAGGAIATAGTAPCWVKLLRAGAIVRAYRSADGVTWEQIGEAQTITLSATALAGLAVTAHNDAALNHSDFSNVSLDPLPPFEAWRHQHFTAAQLANPAVSGALVDANGDGFENLLAYSAGASPWLAAGLRPAPATGSGKLSITFTRNTAASDLTLTVQAADSPAGPWTDIARSTGGAAFVPLVAGADVNETGTGPLRTVEVRDIHLIDSVARPRRFLRLSVRQ